MAEPLKEGLPWWAFAVVGRRTDPSSWKLPHHTRAVASHSPLALSQGTVDWDRAAAAVAALSPGGFRGQQVQATDTQGRAGALHLALHYRRAQKPVPETLQELLRGR